MLAFRWSEKCSLRPYIKQKQDYHVAIVFVCTCAPVWNQLTDIHEITGELNAIGGHTLVIHYCLLRVVTQIWLMCQLHMDGGNSYVMSTYTSLISRILALREICFGILYEL
jgi:hypothetical protein